VGSPVPQTRQVAFCACVGVYEALWTTSSELGRQQAQLVCELSHCSSCLWLAIAHTGGSAPVEPGWPRHAGRCATFLVQPVR